MEELEKLPHCADVTRKYCNRFCGILLVDGKYLTVKGYDKKIPVIYGIDYLTHDIPTYTLAPSENYLVCLKLFKSFRLVNYTLQSLVSDDNSNIYEACKQVYPNVVRQLCTNHYKENIRKLLNIRTDNTYLDFMRGVEVLFRNQRSSDDFNRVAKGIYTKYKHDELCVKILLDIDKNKDYFNAHYKVKHTPSTNNLIECFNSHLNGRLKTIKGFESFKHANLWLNAYFIRRRIKKFTDCSGKFKRLNGSCSLNQSSSNSLEVDQLFF